jgi:hypothetical protein
MEAGPKTILVAEDEILIRIMAVDVLREVPSVIVPLNWIERNDNGPQSGRFQNPERDDASVQETIAAGAGWEGSAAA